MHMFNHKLHQDMYNHNLNFLNILLPQLLDYHLHHEYYSELLTILHHRHSIFPPSAQMTERKLVRLLSLVEFRFRHYRCGCCYHHRSHCWPCCDFCSPFTQGPMCGSSARVVRLLLSWGIGHS